MWSPRSSGHPVTCIACGDSVEREEAREYDKFGDRWDREGKSFEHLCKPCFTDLSKQDREAVEDRLRVAETPERQTNTEFLESYLDVVKKT